MESKDFMLAEIKALGRKTADSILSLNEKTKEYGLKLSREQAKALSETHARSLRENKRIELNGSAVDRLILTFRDSPYISQSNYEETLHSLIDMFYCLKNSTWDRVPDGELIEFMKNSFDNVCHGSIELLSDEALKLSEHIHCKGNVKTYNK